MKFIAPPSQENDYHLRHITLMLSSFRRLIGREFLENVRDDRDAAKQIFMAPFVVLSHNNSTDPVFNYANQTALKLFEMDWFEFTALPSRKSAEPHNREERAHLLHKVSEKGFIEDYSGIRISKSGRRFQIMNAVVWNLFDNENKPYGQAAYFSQWRYLKD